jgi:hypothetical protein
MYQSSILFAKQTMNLGGFIARAIEVGALFKTRTTDVAKFTQH